MNRGTDMTTIAMLLASAQGPLPFVAAFWQSVFSSPVAVILVLMGSVTILLSAVAFVQTRTWPRASPVSKDDDDADDAQPTDSGAEAAPAKPARVARPATTTDLIRIRFPAIAEQHPDVWDDEASLDVHVRVDRDRFAADAVVQVVLSGQADGHRRVFGTTEVDSDGWARFRIEPKRKGEIDLVAALAVDGEAEGQAVRAIRIVDYRAEVVETFEDFVTWAASQFGFVDRKRTAREFVDMFIDGRPGTPAASLDEVVDIYEIANFSDHPVDRATYLRLVDAFLELEEAGALEGAEET